jgi:DNA-binding Lrp family transcriptional regulator
MKACILIKTDPGKNRTITKMVEKIKGVKIAFPVLGRADVVASVKVSTLEQLSVLAFKIGDTPGVTTTETLVGLEGVVE